MLPVTLVLPQAVSALLAVLGLLVLWETHQRTCRQKVIVDSTGALLLPRQELRRSPRYDMTWRLIFSGEGMEGRGVTRNVSRDGCCITSPTAVTLGDYLTLRLSPTAPANPFTIELGIVRWVRDDTFGVEFLSIPPDAHDHLLRLPCHAVMHMGVL